MARGKLQMARLSRNMTLDTDLYELTMVAGYRCLAMSGRRACFELFFRTIPDQGGYCVFAGLAPLIDYINNLRFTAEDMEFLSSLGSFSSKALQALEEGIHFSGDIWSLPEGTLVFSIEPLVRVIAPLEEAQFIETALLAIVSYQTLVATKAARLCHAAHGRPVIEFGTRRAQGIEAALGGSRAAYIGGCAATSNVQAGKSYGIPLRGTQAHSWIQSFPSETEAFSKFCEIFADNSVLLVDTYHIRDGLHHAIEVGVRLLRDGKKPPTGIRLDSGDLAYWSKKARLMMDEAGLHQTQILASGDLDEWLIESLVHQKAPIDAFCVGTKLMTSYNTPALGGVYKLAALANNGGVFENRSRLSIRGFPICEKVIGRLTTAVTSCNRYLLEANRFIKLHRSTSRETTPYRNCHACRRSTRDCKTLMFTQYRYQQCSRRQEPSFYGNICRVTNIWKQGK